ncbi:MAG: hypothetical protein RJB62_1661 [Pseudomonadota bacterium]|jgi:uncharacterized protein YecE (DUF72 family)
MMTSPILIGTAGWSLSSRYVGDVPLGGTHLERYARILPAVEINSSFYRPHRRKTYERWASSTPASFRFSVKTPKVITHEHRLQECGALLDRFVDETAGLGEKLGALLVQLPPTLVFDRQAAGRFFNEVRARTDAPIALEPRHASWFAEGVKDGLDALRIARVAADPAPVSGAEMPGGYDGFA